MNELPKKPEYDNSGTSPYRIYKKRKEESFFDECDNWTKEDIFLLTQDKNANKRDLNQ